MLQPSFDVPRRGTFLWTGHTHGANRSSSSPAKSRAPGWLYMVWRMQNPHGEGEQLQNSASHWMSADLLTCQFAGYRRHQPTSGPCEASGNWGCPALKLHCGLPNVLKPAPACQRSLGSDRPGPFCRSKRAIERSATHVRLLGMPRFNCFSALSIPVVGPQLRCRQSGRSPLSGYLRPSDKRPTIASLSASTSMNKGGIWTHNGKSARPAESAIGGFFQYSRQGRLRYR